MRWVWLVRWVTEPQKKLSAGAKAVSCNAAYQTTDGKTARSKMADHFKARKIADG
jgi:hypothetical protein